LRVAGGIVACLRKISSKISETKGVERSKKDNRSGKGGGKKSTRKNREGQRMTKKAERRTGGKGLERFPNFAAESIRQNNHKKHKPKKTPEQNPPPKTPTKKKTPHPNKKGKKCNEETVRGLVP